MEAITAEPASDRFGEVFGDGFGTGVNHGKPLHLLGGEWIWMDLGRETACLLNHEHLLPLVKIPGQLYESRSSCGKTTSCSFQTCHSHSQHDAAAVPLPNSDHGSSKSLDFRKLQREVLQK